MADAGNLQAHRTGAIPVASTWDRVDADAAGYPIAWRKGRVWIFVAAYMLGQHRIRIATEHGPRAEHSWIISPEC